MQTRPAPATPWLCSPTATSWSWLDKQLRNTPPRVASCLPSAQQRSPLLSRHSAFNVFQSEDGDYLYAFDLFVGEESRGHNSSVEVQRFTETGAPDPTFANPSFHFIPPGGPEIQAVVQGVAVAANGDIVVVGSQTHFTQPGPITSNGLARLTSAGALDSTFGNGGLLANVPPSDAGLSAVIVQPDGNIVTAGVGGEGLVLRRFLGK